MKPLLPLTLLALFGAAAVAWADYTELPRLLASALASATIVLFAPDSPGARPRAVLGGHLLGSGMGLLLLHGLGPGPVSLGLAVGLAVAAMLVTDTLHAPAAGNPLVIFTTRPGWLFLITPTLLGALAVVILGLLYRGLRPTGRVAK